jgi:hypothetical protein
VSDRRYGAYSPECVEDKFSEVHSSKQPIKRGGEHSWATWRHPFGVETRRLSSVRCAVTYQGVATRNDATTREILAHSAGAQPNFASTFSEVHMAPVFGEGDFSKVNQERRAASSASLIFVTTSTGSSTSTINRSLVSSFRWITMVLSR